MSSSDVQRVFLSACLSLKSDVIHMRSLLSNWTLNEHR